MSFKLNCWIRAILTPSRGPPTPTTTHCSY